ncbi:hypothetical protein KM043_011116 [Ampulex compressa]|nr:hypothetical protein KM043_011116 [Ampulex compressa]
MSPKRRAFQKYVTNLDVESGLDKAAGPNGQNVAGRRPGKSGFVASWRGCRGLEDQNPKSRSVIDFSSLSRAVRKDGRRIRKFTTKIRSRPKPIGESVQFCRGFSAILFRE